MPTSHPLACTRITEESHHRFGNLSGDLNPIHTDPFAARHMDPGALLAYGMNLVLWALESLAGSGQLPTSLARVRARFLKWVYLGDEVALHAAEGGRKDLHIFHLLVNDTPVANLELFLGERQPARSPHPQSLPPQRLTHPRDLTLEQLEGREGAAAGPQPAEAAIHYPALTQALGAASIAELATCSYIVGMEAPGLYSMSLRYDLHLTSAAASEEPTGLRYRVVSVDPRFRKAKIAVAGVHITGALEAMVRTPSQKEAGPTHPSSPR